MKERKAEHCIFVTLVRERNNLIALAKENKRGTIFF